MAKGRGTVLPLPDGSPERLTGGYKNEVVRYGDDVLRLEKTTLESAEWEHRLLHALYSLTSKARCEPFSQEYVDHLLRALA